MIEFIKEILKTTRFLIAMAAVTALLWLLSFVALWSATSAYLARGHYHEALRHHRQGNDKEAIRELRTNPASKRGFAESYSLAAKIAFDAKDYDKAEMYFRDSMAYGRDRPELQAELQHALAITQIMRSFFPGHALSHDGVSKLREVVQQWQNSGDAFVNLGSAFLHEGKTLSALSSYRKALKTKNVSREGIAHLYSGLGVIRTREAKNAIGFEREDLLNMAIAQFRKAELIDPGSFDVKANMIMLNLFLAGNKPLDRRRRKIVERAQEFYDKHRKQTSDSLRYALYHNLALIRAAEKEYDRSADAFTAALEVYPRSEVDAFNRAVVRVLAARSEPSSDAIALAEAQIKRFTSARSAKPRDNFLLLVALAGMEYAWPNVDAATKHFEMAAKLIDDATPAVEAANVYRALAIIKYKDEKIREAQELIQRALEYDPEMSDLKAITKSLKSAPGISRPVVLIKPGLPHNMPVVRSEIYNKSTSKPLGWKNIKITIGGKEALFELTEHSQIVAMPAQPLEEGLHEIKVRATDYLGNTSERQEQVVIDKSPPEVTVTPPPGATLKPGRHTFTVAIRDKVSPVDYRSIKLTVSVSVRGRYQFFDLIKEGEFTERAGAERAGAQIEEDEFSFELEKPLTPGKCNFSLEAADVLRNKMDTYRWGYTIEKEEDK